jgi:hypothetical protein
MSQRANNKIYRTNPIEPFEESPAKESKRSNARYFLIPPPIGNEKIL